MASAAEAAKAAKEQTPKAEKEAAKPEFEFPLSSEEIAKSYAAKYYPSVNPPFAVSERGEVFKRVAYARRLQRSRKEEMYYFEK